MAGVTTATIPEDWASLSGHSQEIPNGCTCLIPEIDNMRLDFIVNISLHNGVGTRRVGVCILEMPLCYRIHSEEVS